MSAPALVIVEEIHPEEEAEISGIHVKIPSAPPLPDEEAPGREARRMRAVFVVIAVAIACGFLGIVGAASWFGRITMPMIAAAVVIAAVQVARGQLRTK